jgi:tRNA (mo5U34)-methyltransferase
LEINGYAPPVSDGPPLAAEAQLAGDAPDELRERIAKRFWYHTIELAPGIVTPGFFDHRPIAPKVMPPTLSGRRCLDVATFDGFWAVEMTVRSAREVVAVDLLDPRRWDWPAGSSEETIATLAGQSAQGDGFQIVRQALKYDIERVDCSVYDLDPSKLGSFDLVFVGSLLIHVRDPVRALEAVRRLVAPGGELLLMDNIDPITSFVHPRRPIATLDGDGRPWWWRLNLSGLVQAVKAAGFDLSAAPNRIRLPRGVGRPVPPLRLSTLRHSPTRVNYYEALFGDAHAVIRARPRPGL